jgi:hypothetical protein
MPRWVRPLMPIRSYRSGDDVWLLRLGGALSLLIGITILLTVFFVPYH